MTTTPQIPLAPCGNTNQMPDDASQQAAYARLDKNMLYFLWQNAWTQPKASGYVQKLLVEEPSVANALKGKLAVVTGVTVGGAGYHVAEELAATLEMDVVLLGRSKSKLEAAAASIEKKGGGKLYQAIFDLDDLTTAVSAAEDVRKIAAGYDDAVHILVNNAGANVPKRGLTKQGIEVNTGRNFCAPHQLTRELVPLLKQAGEASKDRFTPRVVFVASIGHVSGYDFDVKRLAEYPDEGGAPASHFSKCSPEVAKAEEKEYVEGEFMGGAKMYMYAKYAMIATAYAWAKAEPSIAFYSLQPGSINSNFGGNAHWLLNLTYYKLFYLFQFTSEQGAVSTLRACLDPTLVEAHPDGAYLHADGNPCMPRAPADGTTTVQELGDEIYEVTNALCDKLLGKEK